jgi:phosphate uptake regulator
MKKMKFAALLLSLAFTLTAVSPAMAACNSPLSRQVYDQIQVTCSRKEIVSAAKDAKNLVKAERIVAQANEKIEDLVAHAQRTKKDDVAKLLDQVDKLVEKTTKQVAKLGYEVACTYTAYVVDGQTVLIDPLRVIQPR